MRLRGAITLRPATGAPTISGTAEVGQTLTAATSGIMDADGLASPGYTYQWIRVDGGTESDISGETSSAYTLVAADQGKTIKVKVSFSDDDSNAETLTSAATAAVDDCADNASTTCTVSVGSSVTGDIERGGDLDWFRLSVASGVTYTILLEGSGTGMGTLGDPELDILTSAGATIANNDYDGGNLNSRIVWTAPDSQTYYLRARSAVGGSGTYTLTVSANNPATGAPTISGTAQVGETLTAATSGIMDADSLNNVAYTYQWIRVDGGTEADISGTTSST